MIRTLKVWWYKRKARNAHLTWRDANSDLDCGIHMAAMVRPLAEQHARNQAAFFDIYMDKLRALGESILCARLTLKEPSHDNQ